MGRKVKSLIVKGLYSLKNCICFCRTFPVNKWFFVRVWFLRHCSNFSPLTIHGELCERKTLANFSTTRQTFAKPSVFDDGTLPLFLFLRFPSLLQWVDFFDCPYCCSNSERFCSFYVRTTAARYVNNEKPMCFLFSLFSSVKVAGLRRGEKRQQWLLAAFFIRHTDQECSRENSDV